VKSPLEEPDSLTPTGPLLSARSRFLGTRKREVVLHIDGNGVIRPLSDGSGCSPIQLKLESGLTLGLPHGVNQMLRGIRLFSLLLLGPGAALYSPQAVAQVLNPTGLEQGDSTNQVLFFDGGSPDSPTRGYTDTHQRGADINIFKDFPGLQEFYGTSLTAGPEGTTLFATILNFGGHNIRRWF
jgi:hypothetical protein